MKSIGFSFKAEPFWLLVFSLSPTIAGMLVFFIVMVMKFVGQL